MLDRLKEIVTDLCQKWEVELLEFNGEADYVHLLVDMHSNIMPSKFINNLKTVTSRLMRKESAKHLAKFYWEPVLWTRAYCLLTTGGLRLIPSDNILKNKNALIRALVLTSPPEKQCFARKIIGGELRTIS